MHHTVLHLTLNRGLLSSGYFEKFQKSGNYVVNVPSYEVRTEEKNVLTKEWTISHKLLCTHVTN